MPDIIGGSLAGAAAALELLSQGAPVRIFEKSAFPRHKVCGEFLDGAAAAILNVTGAPITTSALVWPGVRKEFTLPRPAVGLSRFQLDHTLLTRAVEAGAELIPEKATPHPAAIVAHGRHARSQRGQRLFGYKAHFSGPPSEAVELYFHSSGYTGINPIEDSLTNVCGLAREEDLRAVQFRVDEFLARQPHTAQRLTGLQRQLDWLFTGPLFYGPTVETAGYPCGDALSFVDPFTGSGMLCAVLTGQLAARSVLAGRTPAEHIAQCRSMLLPAYRWSSFLRRSLSWPLVPRLAQLVPGALLYAQSRPRVHLATT
jgi:flavin-dependent dehydrogenase